MRSSSGDEKGWLAEPGHVEEAERWLVEVWRRRGRTV